MAVNWNDPQQVQAFKTQVVADGANPQEADAYIAQQQSTAAAMQPMPQQETVTPAKPKTVPGFLQNIVKSGIKTGEDIFSGVVNILNPDMEKNTAVNLAKLGIGTGQLLLPGEQGLEDRPRAVGDFYKNRYGSLDAVKETLYNDPVGALLDVSVVADVAGLGLKAAGTAGKSEKLLKASDVASDISKATDPVRLITSKTGDVINPKLATAGSKIDEAGTGIRKAGAPIYVKPSIYGAEREAKIAKVLDEAGAIGSSQAKYEALSKIIESKGIEIADKLAKNPVPLEPGMVADLFKEKISSTIRTSDLTLPEAQKMVTKYLDDLAEMPVENMTSQDLFGLKQVVNGDTSRIYDKLEKGLLLTPKEEVILAFRNTLDDIISKTNPEVKKLTVDQSLVYDAVDSLNRSRKTNPTTRIAGTTVPTTLVQSAVDRAGSKLQDVGQGLMSKQIPEISMTSATKQLVGADRSLPGLIQDGSQDNRYNMQDSTGNEKSNVNLGSEDNNKHIVESIPSVRTNPQSGEATYNPYGATAPQIWEAYIRTLSSGNKRKAAILKEMFDHEVKQKAMENPKVNSSGAKALSDNQTAIDLVETLDETITEYSEKMGPIAGRVYSSNPYDVDAQTFRSQMTAAAQVIGKTLEGGVLRAEDTKKYEKILPQITDTPAVAKNKIKAVKKLLENQQKNQEYFYKGANPDAVQQTVVEGSGGGNPGLNLGSNTNNNTLPGFMYR